MRASGYAFVLTLLSTPASAQVLNGGTGGPALDVPAGTTVVLPLPADGSALQYSTITVNGTLRFAKNSLNSPVVLLATGDVTITGTIDIAGAVGTANSPGAGGPGGFDGGHPGMGSIAAGPGHGPGGGAGGTSTAEHGSHASGPRAYGSPLLVPLVGGSGGGGRVGMGGGGGGGAILIASNTRISVAGTIDAQGANNSTGGGDGSGGAIRLVAPRVEGSGWPYVPAIGHPGASAGRVRIDVIDRTGMAFNFAGVAPSIGTYMVAIPNVVPRIEIVSAAGVAVTSGASATIVLPFGSNPSTTIDVRGLDFAGGTANAIVRLEPSSGAAIEYPVTLTNNVVASVPVTFPINDQTRVMVWATP